MKTIRTARDSGGRRDRRSKTQPRLALWLGVATTFLLVAPSLALAGGPSSDSNSHAQRSPLLGNGRSAIRQGIDRGRRFVVGLWDHHVAVHLGFPVHSRLAFRTFVENHAESCQVTVKPRLHESGDDGLLVHVRRSLVVEGVHSRGLGRTRMRRSRWNAPFAGLGASTLEPSAAWMDPSSRDATVRRAVQRRRVDNQSLLDAAHVLADELAHELPDGVNVTVIEPGSPD